MLLSKQLSESWIQVTTLQKAQDTHLKELSKSREKSTTLEKDLAEVQDQLKSTKKELAQARSRWEADKEDLEADIRSLKVEHVFCLSFTATRA